MTVDKLPGQMCKKIKKPVLFAYIEGRNKTFNFRGIYLQQGDN